MKVKEAKEILKDYDDSAELEILSNGKAVGIGSFVEGDNKTLYLEAGVDKSIEKYIFAVGLTLFLVSEILMILSSETDLISLSIGIMVFAIGAKTFWQTK